MYPTEEASRVFSPPSAPKLGAFSTSAATRTFEFSPAEGLDKALEAPTTEIATGYGAEEGYEKNMREFSEVLNGELKGKEDAGFHGCVVGTTVQDISREEGGEKAKAVALVVGWDSREKHMEGREVGGKSSSRSGFWFKGAFANDGYRNPEQDWVDQGAEEGDGYVACQLQGVLSSLWA